MKLLIAVESVASAELLARSYLSTMKKQGCGVMEIIKSVFTGKRIMPALRC